MQKQLNKFFAVIVLLLCVGVGNVWGWSIWGGKTVYIDNSIAGWSQPAMQVKKSDGYYDNYDFTRIGTTDFWYKAFNSDWDGYDHITYFESSDWNKRTTDQSYDLHPSSFVVIVPKGGTGSSNAVGKFEDTKKAYPNHRIYFDATSIAGWGNKAYLRYGFDCVAHADPLTKFPGTANLWYIDVKEAYYQEYTVANGAGNTKGNTVWQPTSDCKPTGEYAITKSLNFSPTDIDGGTSTILRFTATTKASTSEDCDWYNYDKTTNSSMPTQTVTVGSTTNGKIRVDYTGTNGVATYWEGSGGTTLTVPQSAIITVTAVPNDLYYHSALSVNSSSFTSGETHTVTASTTIAATFAHMYAFVEANLQVYNSERNSRTKTGSEWTDASTAIPMEYDGTNHRFYLHTYSTPAELAEQLNSRDAYFYIRTSTSSSSLSGGNKYYANGSGANQSLSAYGTSNKKETKKDDSSNSFKFTGSEDGYVILYFDGTHVWYELECKVTYDGNDKTGGITPTDATYYAKGATVTVAAEPTNWAKTGYTFGGWNTANDGSGSNYAAGDGTFTINANTTLYAKWTQDVTLDNTGYTTAGSTSVTLTYNSSTHAALTNPAKTGYTFNGWYTGEGGTGSLVINPSGVLQNSVSVSTTNYTDASGNWIYSGSAPTLYAKWTPNTYYVRFENLDADAGHKGSQDTTVTFNDTINMKGPIEKPSKNYYTFDGYWISTDKGKTIANLTHQLIDANGYWIKDVSPYTGNDGDNHATWILAADTVLYAKWTETLHTITVAAGANGSVSTGSVNVGNITSSGAITATPDAGYHFRDWTLPDGEIVTTHEKTSSTNATIYIKATASGTITANFDPTNYTIRLEDKGADEGHKGTPNVTATYNASTNLTSAIDCPQKRYYDFDGYWISTDGGNTLTTQLINADGTWKKNISGYTGESDENATWVCAGDTTLYAKWIEHAYTVTASVSPEGAGSVNTVTDAHLTIPSSTITATPVNAAWVFDHWVCGDSVGIASGSGTNAVTVTAAKNSTITAYFKPRYELVGSYWNDDKEGNGGMPGWNRDGTGDFTINRFDAVNTDNGVNLSYTCSLNANKSYKLKIHDKKDGDYGKLSDNSYYTMEANEVTEFGDGNKDVWIHTGGASGLFTFRITKMREDNGKYYPTLSIERPQQVNFGTGYAGIDDVTVTVGTKGGTLAVDTASTTITTGTYVTYGANVNHDPTAATGYTFAGFYTSSAYSDAEPFTSDDPWMHYNVTSGDNAYAKFTEKPTSIHFANDGHGHVEIGGVTRTDTIVGIDTHRTIEAVPNAGYKFNSWAKTAGTDYDLTSTSSASTTLSGNGGGATSGQTVTANFELRYSIKGTMNDEKWGTDHKISNIGRNANAKDTGYVEINLPANTTYEFAIQDLAGDNKWLKNGIDKVYYMTYAGNHVNWHFGRASQTYNCGITTAGKGTYKFIFNITDTTVTVVYPTSYQVNYGASVGGSVSVVDDDSQTVPNGGYVRSGGSVTYTPAASSGYSFAGWYTDGTYGTWFTNDNPWPNNSVSATSNAYAKFISTNFVIYRTGDKAEDARAALDDVESYDGGTISEAIEFRMKVGALDKWYSLCLPFDVSAVKVWDEEDGKYYNLKPYYRTSAGSKLQNGHYIIRYPNKTTDFELSDFGNWIDPTTNDGYLPSANTPYIIQWHNAYFLNRYVSFFSATGETIPTDFSAGSAPSADNVVNVCTNNTMHTGSIAGAYMLEADYGSNGAWLRLDNVETSRTIPPFECYLLANGPTRARFKAMHRDMNLQVDTPTGFLPVTDNPSSITRKVLIDGQIYIIRGDRIYTAQGVLVKGGE